MQFNIENAGNSCYIDSTLFSMFVSTGLGAMLDSKQFSGEGGDDKRNLKELIVDHFLNPLKKCLAGQSSGTSVECVTTKEAMIKIREMCRTLGWKNTESVSSQQDAVEFFGFLGETLEVPKITKRRMTFHPGNTTPSDWGDDETLWVLPLPLCSVDSQHAKIDLDWLLEKCLVDNIVPDLLRPVATGDSDESCEVKRIPALLT
jgi:hypothetical protein